MFSLPLYTSIMLCYNKRSATACWISAGTYIVEVVHTEILAVPL